MKIIKKILIITSILLIPAPFITAESYIENANYYNIQLESFLNNTTASPIIAENLNTLSSETSEASDFKNLYLHSKIMLLRGIIIAQTGNVNESVLTLLTAQSAAEKALELKTDADCYRILGEAGSAIMLQKGVPYIITHGGKVEKYIDKAIELDPQNIRAGVLKAQSLINKPFIFGGNVKKGINLLSELEATGSSIKADRFFVLYNLSIGLQKHKKYNEAIKTCIEALTLYPDNLNAGELLSKMNN